jgi:hypothetical protein
LYISIKFLLATASLRQKVETSFDLYDEEYLGSEKLKCDSKSRKDGELHDGVEEIIFLSKFEFRASNRFISMRFINLKIS